MSLRVVLVDYESGNLHSAQKAFERMIAEAGGGCVEVSADPEALCRASHIVLPGDGAFPACREALDAVPGMVGALEDQVVRGGKPFLGICVGMQLLSDRGREYRDTPGLGWIGGEVVRIEPRLASLKVPHMGWNDLVVTGAHPVLEGIETGDHAYFVHSFHFAVTDPRHQLAHADYDGPRAAVVGHDNIVGTQFHPEKSHATGLRLIANFLRWKP